MTTFWGGGRKERKKKRTALFLLFAYFLCRRRFVAPFGPFPGKMEKKIKKEKFYFSNERNFDSTGRGRKLHQRADAHIYSLMAFYRGSRDSLSREKLSNGFLVVVPPSSVIDSHGWLVQAKAL
jgi:hypothetical protein